MEKYKKGTNLIVQVTYQVEIEIPETKVYNSNSLGELATKELLQSGDSDWFVQSNMNEHLFLVEVVEVVSD